MKKLSTIVIHTLFLITPLVFFSKTSELFEFNKIIFIYICSIFLLGLFLFNLIFNKYKLKFSFLDIITLIFLLSQILSTIFSIDRHTSIFGYYGRFNGGLVSIIAYITIYLSIKYLFILNNVQSLLKTSIFSSILVIFWGLPGKFGYDLSCFLFTGQLNNGCWTNQFHPDQRMFSTLGQPNWLGAYLAVNFLFGLFFFIRSINIKSRCQKIVWFLYLILNFSGILFTRSRSSLLALFIGIAIFVFLHFIRVKRSLGISILIIIGLLIFVTVNGVDFSKTITSVFSSKKNISTQTNKFNVGVTDSFDIRQIVWEGAIKLGNRYPLFGSGVETFAYAYYFVRPQSHNLTSEWDYLYNKAHNEYLNYYATTGVVGIVTYIILIIGVFILSFSNLSRLSLKIKELNKNEVKNKQIYNNLRILNNALMSGYSIILITNFFGFSTTTINLFFYSIPALLLIINLHLKNFIFNNQNPVNLVLTKKILLFIIVIICINFIIGTVRYYNADLLYNQAESYSSIDRYDIASSLYLQALNNKYEHVYIDKLSYSLANMAMALALQKDKSAEKIRKLSEYYNQKSLSDAPYNVLYWKTKAKNQYLYYQIGLDKNELLIGIKALEKAKALSPTDPKIPYSLGIYYSLMEDVEKNINEKKQLEQNALIQINQAIALKPDYRDAYLLKGQLQKKFKLTNEAIQTFKFILEKFDKNDATVLEELKSLIP